MMTCASLILSHVTHGGFDSFNSTPIQHNNTEDTLINDGDNDTNSKEI